MIRVIRCANCGHYCTETDLQTKTVDLENEHGVGSLFPDHHREEVRVCPECGSSSLEEENFDERDLADLLNDFAEIKKHRKGKTWKRH